MYLAYHFNTRDRMIAFGRKIGGAIAISDRPDPWMISLDGDFDSGKSLLALAIDVGLRPDAYPNGLTHDFNADAHLMGRQTGQKTVFKNFGHVAALDKNSFDHELGEFEREYPGPRIFIASNIDRTLKGAYNYKAQGLNSDRLDIAIGVHKVDYPFERHVSITMKDPALRMALLV